MNFQNYVRAKTLEEAYELNQKKNNYILGGMLWMKMNSNTIGTAIDLCDLGLDYITESDEEFRIGCMCTLRTLEINESLNHYANNAVRDALRDIVGVQFRNMATVGGSIFGRFGFSDVLTVFLAMDAYVELYKGGIIPLSTFVDMPKDSDILVSLIIKKTPIKIVYDAVRISRTDFPVLNCAMSLVGINHHTVVGARPGKAILYRELPEDFENFSEYMSEVVPTESNSRGSATYRSHLVKVLVSRNLARLEEM